MNRYAAFSLHTTCGYDPLVAVILHLVFQFARFGYFLISF